MKEVLYEFALGVLTLVILGVIAATTYGISLYFPGIPLADIAGWTIGVLLAVGLIWLLGFLMNGMRLG